MVSIETYDYDHNIKIGHPPSNGDNWQLNARPAEALDAAGVEIISYPNTPYENDNVLALRTENEALPVTVPKPLRWLLKKSLRLANPGRIEVN